MNSILRAKLPMFAAAAMLSASLSLAQNPEHPKPVKHKAQKVQKHPAPQAQRHDPPKATKHKAHAATKHAAPKVRKRSRGQQAIDSSRATQIQEALAREHYLKSSPTGNWDAATQDAMRRYQADHGWQNKTVPDSRALISLGLGPDHDHLLNPESAMTTGPQLPHSSPNPSGSSASVASSKVSSGGGGLIAPAAAGNSVPIAAAPADFTPRH